MSRISFAVSSNRGHLRGSRFLAFSAVLTFALVGHLALASAARAAGGSALGWGYNNEGQLGAPSGTEVTTPRFIAGLTNVTQIAPGEYHTLALLEDGTVRALGANSRGALGDGTVTDSDVPVQPIGASRVVAVASGGYFSLALLDDGTVMTWGENAYGQLGLGTTAGPEACGDPCSRIPRTVPGLTDVIAIDAGYSSAMALRADGTVMAWGYDRNGELGDGIGVQAGCDCIDRPVVVPGLPPAVGISLGEYNGAALLSDGTVRTWGYASYGNLGNGALAPVNACVCLGPVQPVGISGVTAVDVGDYHTLAALANGAVMAWGYNLYGEVGDGTKSTTGCNCQPIPTLVASIVNAWKPATAEYTSFALLADGTVRSWGEEDAGELGDPPTEQRSVPGPVGGLGGVSDLDAGDYDVAVVVGPSQALTVSHAGADSGAVGTQALVCPPSCSTRFAQGQVRFLRADPAPGTAGFAGFSGACSGTGACQVRMDGDRSVTATFGRPKGTTITRAKVRHRKRRAKFFFTAPGAITGYQCKLIGPKRKKRYRKSRKHDRHGRHPLERRKRRKPRFRSCSSPRTYKKLSPGTYRFRVRALDILGADAKPANRKFKVRTVQRKRRRAPSR
jgi:alpha-tubulin suppressor-like RCC1 family protein